MEVAENAVAAPDDRPRLPLDEETEGVGVAGQDGSDDATSLRIIPEARVGPLEIARGVDRSASSWEVARRAMLPRERYAARGVATRIIAISVVVARRAGWIPGRSAVVTGRTRRIAGCERGRRGRGGDPGEAERVAVHGELPLVRQRAGGLRTPRRRSI
ncbi:MAG TPA: hypothetical protein VLM76_06045 [Patescibacteria group bacterium]|nr:hypothetical protein [Patescibacteria group bacterium]